MNVRTLCFAATLLVPACALAGEFDAYRVPEHTWQSGTASFAAAYDRNSTTVGGPYSTSGRQTNAGGGLGLSFARGYDSDRFQRSWRAEASGTTNGTTDEREEWDGTQSLDAWQRANRGNFLAAGDFRAYPERREIGMDLSAWFQATGDQGRLRRDVVIVFGDPTTRSESRQNQQANGYSYAGNAMVTLGHGIVRDATVVEDVHVLEQRLLTSGALSRTLTPGGREKLAALLAATPFITYAHERPDRYEWREIERVLREDGALAGETLDAYGLLRAREPYLRLSSQRRTGHFAGLAAMFEHRHDIARTASDYTTRDYQADTLLGSSEYGYGLDRAAYGDRAYVGVAAEWHRPSGWRVQWDAAGRALASARPGEHGLTEQLDLTGEWHVADRWQVTGGFHQERGYLEPGSRDDSSPEDSWSTVLAGVLDYFVEDNLSVQLAIYDQQARRRQQLYADVTYDDYAHAGRVQLGLRYHFLGRVSAPGLFERMVQL